MLSSTRWNPFADLLAMQRDMSNFVNRALGGTEPSGGASGRGTAWVPGTEAFYKDDALVVRAWLPGIDANKVDLQIVGNMLTLKGERVFPYHLPENAYLYSDVAYGPFERVLTLPENLKFDRISAKSVNGVLEITIPVHEGALPKKISIDVQTEPKTITATTR
jgi:HSP20 family protein